MSHDHPDADGPAPSYVLVHGGGSTGRYWDRVVPLLDGPALAVDLPGRADRPADLGTLTVDDEVASVVADVRAALPDGPIVLVAHSSGGLVVPGVVAGLDGRVAHVVLNAALVPPEGGCGLDCMKPAHRDGLVAVLADADRTGEPVILPGPPTDLDRARTNTGGDPLSDDDLAFVVDPVRAVSDTVHHYRQPVHWSRAGAVPVTYVVNDRDRPVAPAMQAEMIGRLPHPPVVDHLDAGHLTAVTHPAELAAAIVGAASSTDAGRP